MGKHRRLSNSAFKVEIDELIAKADGNAEDYGLTQDLIDEFKADNVGFGKDIAAQALKKAEAKASTTKLNTTRKMLNDKYSKAKKAAKDSGVSADKLAEINFEPDDAVKSVITPQTPIDLLVQGFSSGKNSLKWKGNGNKAGTIYIIEAKIGSEPKFLIVGTTTKTRFDHKDQKPGVKAVYRVKAQRGDDYSEYSNEAIVYE